jgi:hypothetical protein
LAQPFFSASVLSVVMPMPSSRASSRIGWSVFS